MRPLFDKMARCAAEDGGRIALSDADGPMTRAELLARVAGLRETLRDGPDRIGLFAANGRHWAIGMLAAIAAGKTVVPLPTFFSSPQLGHVVRDAGVQLILADPSTWPRAVQSGVTARLIGPGRVPPFGTWEVTAGSGVVIYTSGSTGRPKGVRHGESQLLFMTDALAEAISASSADRYLSLLPLPQLLETLCAIFVPAHVGAAVHFAPEIAEGIGRGTVAGVAAAFERHRPTVSVLVPQLLALWLAELGPAGRAPQSVRLVAVGGAPTPSAMAEAAWSRGIPVHEGYGLSECCSVVAMNRPGRRQAGTCGRVLTGVAIAIDDGEIVVTGPSVMDGYLHQGAKPALWRTGDLGSLDPDGVLTVHGRKDNLIVRASGRNISPEWIETLLLADGRIAHCALVDTGRDGLAAVIIPRPSAWPWFEALGDAERLTYVRTRCQGVPDYAIPRHCVVVAVHEAADLDLLTSNGRIRRSRAAGVATDRVGGPLTLTA
jgi:long-subunit acyl-CoA synthetase (AMP-forming)